MELPDLGEHCTLPSCKQLDFLPFTCDACKQVYCKDHVKYSEHQCALGQDKDRRVPVCPLCSQPVSITASDNVDRKINEHIENDCKSDLAKHKRTNKCNVKGCKQHILVPVLCAACKRNFCLRHRHENDHDCGAQPGGSRTSAASVRAGQEAAKRVSSNTTKKTPPSRNSQPSRTPQTSMLSSIGANLNQSRNDRMMAPPSRSAASASQYMPSDVSSDQALALALQASLNEGGSQAPPPQPPAKTLTRQEREDMELARALQESERLERERQRSQEQSSKKDNCIIS